MTGEHRLVHIIEFYVLISSIGNYSILPVVKVHGLQFLSVTMVKTSIILTEVATMLTYLLIELFGV